MAEDLEVGVMLKPKNDLEDEVDPVTGDSGDDQGTPAQRQEQENTIAGGVSQGIIGAGIFAGILSQLKSVTGLINAVLGFFSRALLPAVEVIADVIRPLIEGINDFIADPVGTVESGIDSVVNREKPGLTAEDRQSLRQEALASGEARRGPLGGTIEPGSPAESLYEFLNLIPDSADQTGEATKQQFKQNLDEAQKDKTGSFQ